MCSGSAMDSPIGILGSSEANGSWKTTWTSRRTSRSACGRTVRPAPRPSKRTEPDVGATSCSTERPVVVFPQPDSPTSPSVSPRSMEKSTPQTACTMADLVASEGLAPLGVVLDQVGHRQQGRGSRRRPTGWPSGPPPSGRGASGRLIPVPRLPGRPRCRGTSRPRGGGRPGRRSGRRPDATGWWPSGLGPGGSDPVAARGHRRSPAELGSSVSQMSARRGSGGRTGSRCGSPTIDGGEPGIWRSRSRPSLSSRGREPSSPWV